MWQPVPGWQGPLCNQRLCSRPKVYGPHCLLICRYHPNDTEMFVLKKNIFVIFLYSLFSDANRGQDSAHWAKIGGHVDIQMCHFVSFWARKMLFTSNALLWPMDEILSLWPRFSFESYMILEFQAMSTCWPNVHWALCDSCFLMSSDNSHNIWL